MDGAFAGYDEVPYPGRPYPQTHPDRLATLAFLYGLDPKPVSRCRVLELGCGDGANLVPVACQWPESAFVGVDLSARSIAAGTETIAALGLRNVTLRQADIMDLGPELGTFDYIVAHGVYSWVPEPVRAKILAVFAANLAPNGVAYVSYNCQPASHLRNIAREIMLYHVRDIADPRERVAQARAILTFVYETREENDVYRAVLRDQIERVGSLRDQVLFHDDLDPVSTPFSVAQVAEAAARQGLRYLADAVSPPAELANVAKAHHDLLAGIPAGDRIAREQYFDFLAFRSFRQTLLCRADVPLAAEIAPARIRSLHVAAAAVPKDPNLDPAADGVAEFGFGEAGRLSLDHALSKAALLHLGEAWPRAIPFDDLVAAALARLGRKAEAARRDLDEHVEALTTVLFRAYAAEALHLSATPPRLAARVAERPTVSPLARHEVRTGPAVTTLLHQSVRIEDDLARRFIPLVDGTRTVDDLVAALRAPAGTGEARGGGDRDGTAPDAPVVTRGTVRRNLDLLLGLGLLVG